MVSDQGLALAERDKSGVAHPDDDDPTYDGYGRHNAVISNLEDDDRGNLHFVAGHGVPYNISENLPFTTHEGPTPDLLNYQWLQWGHDLATKISSFPTDEAGAWDLIQRLASIMNWEVGVRTITAESGQCPDT